jgi:hypothetical protein
MQPITLFQHGHTVAIPLPVATAKKLGFHAGQRIYLNPSYPDQTVAVRLLPDLAVEDYEGYVREDERRVREDTGEPFENCWCTAKTSRNTETR